MKCTLTPTTRDVWKHGSQYEHFSVFRVFSPVQFSLLSTLYIFPQRAVKLSAVCSALHLTALHGNDLCQIASPTKPACVFVLRRIEDCFSLRNYCGRLARYPSVKDNCLEFSLMNYLLSFTCVDCLSWPRLSSLVNRVITGGTVSGLWYRQGVSRQ